MQPTPAKGLQVGRLILDSHHADRDGIQEWLAHPIDGREKLIVRFATTPDAVMRLRSERAALAHGSPTIDGPARLRLPNAGYDAGGAEMMVTDIVPARSLQDMLRRGEPVDRDTAWLALDGLLALLEACEREGIAPPDLTRPCTFIVGRQVVVDGVGTGDPTQVGPILRDLAGALAGPDPDEDLAAFADALPDTGMPVVASQMRHLLAVILGAGGSDRLAAASDTSRDYRVTCPGCGVQYLLSANVCRPCQLDLRTGASLAAIRAATRRHTRKARLVQPSHLVVLAAFAGLVSVFGLAFGWQWVLITIGFGVALVALLLATTLLGT